MTTRPSRLIRSPALTRICSPMATDSTGTVSHPVPRFTSAVFGTMERSDFTTLRLFSRQSCSIPSEISKSAMTIAPSAQLPVRIAPITASAMRALILNLKWKNEIRPRLKVETPESATEITARSSPIRSGALKPCPNTVRTEPPAGAKSGISSAAKASTSAAPSFFHGIEVLTGSDDFRSASCAE